jgi:hypothetical protein
VGRPKEGEPVLRQKNSSSAPRKPPKSKKSKKGLDSRLRGNFTLESMRPCAGNRFSIIRRLFSATAQQPLVNAASFFYFSCDDSPS